MIEVFFDRIPETIFGIAYIMSIRSWFNKILTQELLGLGNGIRCRSKRLQDSTYAPCPE